MKVSRPSYRFVFFPLLVAFLLFGKLAGAEDYLMVADATIVDFYMGHCDNDAVGVEKITDGVEVKVSKVAGYHKSLARYCKKYKRASSVSMGIRPHVKKIEAVLFDTRGKWTYAQPFFLSHLHSFLFRLTPF